MPTGIKYTWSYSSLSTFKTCPKQYHEVNVLNAWPRQTSEAMEYGTAVHLALEEAVRDGKPLPKEHRVFQSVVDKMLAIPGIKLTEYKMALKKDRTPTLFDDPDRWNRGIADLIIVDYNKAYIVDYKTGSNRYPDPLQLRLMAAMTFEHFPFVQTIRAQLAFIVRGTQFNEKYQREDREQLWSHFVPTLLKLNKSFADDYWPTTPNPLCGWCPVKTCEENKK